MLGEASVAAAIADRDNEAVAAVAVVFPADQEPVDPKVLTLLRECARNVSKPCSTRSKTDSAPVRCISRANGCDPPS